MLVRFMMYLSVICPDDITIHWGNILAWNHVNDLFLSKMFPDNVATHGCFPPQKKSTIPFRPITVSKILLDT